MELDHLLLSRLQFAFTMSFHFLFPAFTIGLASWLFVLEGLWIVTAREAFRTLYLFWVKVFAVSFGMGVVSGVVMSFEFGTNWGRFSHVGGNVLGPLMSYEVLTAFFLEAGFIGIMLFGWNRVGRGLHFFSTGMVALGTLISSFWILSANSWMHTPAGYTIVDGIIEPVDWWAIIFNPSFPYRFVHTVLATFLTTSMTITGLAGWMLWTNRHRELAWLTFRFGIGFLAVVAPLQIIAGDFSGLNVGEHQPAKLAAIEAAWETRPGQPLVLLAIPDSEAETNHFEIAIPKLASLINTHEWDGVFKGLKDFAPQDRPPVGIVFWSFRVMVAIGFLLVGIGWIGVVLWLMKRLEAARLFHGLAALCTPTGYIAVLAGWYTAEVGRQPWIIYGVMRTADAVTPHPPEQVLASLILFVVVYVVVFGAGVYYLIKILRRGPVPVPEVPATPAGHAPVSGRGVGHARPAEPQP
jgi:cytochrome bd ubiquinol oxidase subunit I